MKKVITLGLCLFTTLTLFIGCFSEEFDDTNFELWEKKSELTDRRLHSATVLHNSTEFYVMGGYWYYAGEEMLRVFANVDIYDAINDRWKTVAPLERGLAGAFAISVGGKIFIGGGYYEEWSGSRKENLKLMSYEPITNQWDYTLPDLPSAAIYPAVATFQNKIYVFGGVDLISEGENDPIEILNSILVYNIYTQSWENCTKTLIVPRADAKAVEMNGYIYIIGGGNRWDESNKFALTSVEQFNVATDQIIEIATIPEPKLNFGCIKYQRQIFAFGGYTNDVTENGKLIRSIKTSILDTNTHTWKEDDRYQLDKATSDFDVFLSNDKLYFYEQPGTIYKLKLQFPIEYENY